MICHFLINNLQQYWQIVFPIEAGTCRQFSLDKPLLYWHILAPNKHKKLVFTFGVLVIGKFPFGPMTINGHVNTSNMLIASGGKVPISWLRSVDDPSTSQGIESLVDSGPEPLIASFAPHIRMKPTPELKRTLAGLGIALVAAWNQFAVKHRASTVMVMRKRENDNIFARYRLNGIQRSAFEFNGSNRFSGCALTAADAFYQTPQSIHIELVT